MRGNTDPVRGSVETGALALQRVLALEGRDVLSRVELAASELERFALAPALALQIGAIREAVGELDSLLDKIERLANPLRQHRPPGESRLEFVLAAIRERLAPALAARGVLLEIAGSPPTRAVAVPAAVLERLVLLWLRTAIAGLAGEESLDDESACVLELACRDGEGEVELTLRPQRVRRRVRFELERATQVELDVALAEWQGLAARVVEKESEWLTLWLPASGGSGGV